jgi:hypothetical protein
MRSAMTKTATSEEIDNLIRELGLDDFEELGELICVVSSTEDYSWSSEDPEDQFQGIENDNSVWGK